MLDKFSCGEQYKCKNVEHMNNELLTQEQNVCTYDHAQKPTA